MCGAPSPLKQQVASGYAELSPKLPFGQPAQDAQMQAQAQGQPSQLPVPYMMPQPGMWGGMQGTQGTQAQPTAVMPFNFAQGGTERGLVPAEQDAASRLPALPDLDMGEAVYIPPMYTNPRPIIPRYRAISGLLSVLIVCILFCSGAGYYAQASGKIAMLRQAVGIDRPQSLKPTPAQALPDPKSSPDYGPAANVINSASTGSKVDAQYIVLQPANTFKPGQTIYLTYSVQTQKKPGVVTIKWYTNGQLYSTYQSQPIKGGTGTSFQVKYPKAAEGKVELYWNNQLAIALYFVVR